MLSLAPYRRLVQTSRMTRLLLSVSLAVLLSACGFHLRNALSLPTDLGEVKVVTGDPYSPLDQALQVALESSGVQVVSGNSASQSASLNVLSERWGDLPIAVDQQGRAQEFSMRYAVTFDLKRADGSVLVPAQVIELSRDYVVPPADSIGRSSERELLVREIRRDMVASILRRLDAMSQVAAPASSATQNP